MPNRQTSWPWLDLGEFDTEFSLRATSQEWAYALEIRRNSNFAETILNYHKQLQKVSTGKYFLNKITSESARYEILGYTLYLHDTRDLTNPRSGLTITNLEKICTKQNCASPGRVRAIIGLMWANGYLKRHQSFSDSRIVHFEPTEKLMGIIEGWNHEIFKTIDELFPDDQLAKRHLVEPGFGSAMRVSAIEQALTGWRPYHLFSEVYHFIAHDAGWLFLIHCIGEMMQERDGATIKPIEVDLAAFGKKFGVSRSHLRRLLESAFAANLLDGPPKNGSEIKLSRKLVASYFLSMAYELQFYRHHALKNLP